MATATIDFGPTMEDYQRALSFMRECDATGRMAGWPERTGSWGDPERRWQVKVATDKEAAE